MNKIVMTGGGSAGHVIVNTVLIPKLINEGWEIIYIGSKNGPEKVMIEAIDGVKYYGVSTGKLRRYLSMENFKDIFKIIKGIIQSFFIIKREKANVIFSCGGFVTVPTVIGGFFNRVPTIIRETDYSIGLANKICMPFAKHISVTFSDTVNEVNINKFIKSGPIIREELKRGSRVAGLKITNFKGDKPIILVMGGSQGAKIINDSLRQSINELVTDFDIIHLCGKGKVDNNIKVQGYIQYEYVGEELSHMYAMSDIVVGRSGSNGVFEGALLMKPMLLIPISKKVSRGDQILNAKYMEGKGVAKVLLEEDLNCNSLVSGIKSIYNNMNKYLINLLKISDENNIERQINIINKYKK
ncbi:MAG: undecaprenyldiphospho-muramoylpentapeptide beta-N-acetylglucosaminyltransferase [Clostridium sp.]|uniref:undecaprenyldiphospho-muramoylpentapeptide beta-N-acetylglucosaminyltransferase n=1 Tax=Clostridium sp. TaxID=1506 RepID=UPI002FC746EB